MSPSTFITLLLATFALAAPAPQFGRPPPPAPIRGPPAPAPRPPVGAPVPRPGPVGPIGLKGCACDTSAAKLTVPANQTALTNPTSKPSFVMLGVGFQNYTCGAAGTYTSAGATADLYDISCLAKNTAQFDNVQNTAMTAWSGSKAKTLGPIAVGSPEIGFHFFQPNPAGGLSPVWDLRAIAGKGNADAFVVAAKTGNTPAPDGTKNVDWLQLKGVTGGLAGTIYRSHTVLGQPPASCQPGSAPIQVKYTSKYWIFDSKVTLGGATPSAPAPVSSAAPASSSAAAPAASAPAPAATPAPEADDAADDEDGDDEEEDEERKRR